jgi:hypothetical protein
MFKRQPNLAIATHETQTFVGREVVTSNSGVLSKELR